MFFVLVPKVAIAEPLQYPYGSIRHWSDKYDVDSKLAIAIATCESDLNPRARSPFSTAKGLFQFIDGSWKYYGLMKWGTLKGKSVLDYEDNAELAVWVMSEFSTKPWDSSRHCWSPDSVKRV